MLKVLTLSTLFPDSIRPTFGTFVERQALELAGRGDVELQVVAPIGLPPGPLKRHPRYHALAALPARETWKGIPVHRPRFPLIPAIGGRFSPALMARAILPLLRDLRRTFAFDAIDAEYFYPDGPATMRVAQALGVPYMVMARGSDIHVWGKMPAARRQILATGREAGALLAVSQAMARDMAALGLPEDRITTCYTGVDQALFHPVDRATAKAGLGIAGPLILSAGTLNANKGHHLLIEALPALPDATLFIAGGGPDRAALERQVAMAGLAARVRFLGTVPHAELAGFHAAADVMALASASEGLATVWVEALAAGTPLVITDAGGAREVVDRPEAGRVVERTPAALAAGIAEILENPPAQQAVRAAALRFSWAANADFLFETLTRISRPETSSPD